MELTMKVRYLGHSCVEIVGKHHVLIDPDFTRNPEPSVEYICISHAHKDHIGRVAEVPNGIVLASPDVCEIAEKMGVHHSRLWPVAPGDQIDNISILPGYSMVDQPVYTFFYFLFRRRLPDPGGTPLSFLIQDEADLLHIGDAHETRLTVHPDILCLPWRTTQFGANRYKSTVIRTVKQFAAPYILPVHFDLPGTEADPSEIRERINAIVLNGENWHSFQNKKEVSIY
jgi:L-ascorbate metabolism protein UlaG (beta-lactamase superfamily)